MPLQRIHSLALSFQRNRRTLRVAVGVLIAAIAGVVLLIALHLRQQALVRTEATTKNLAQSITQTMEGMIATLDVTLQVSADELSRQLATGGIQSAQANAFLLHQQQRLPYLSYVRAADAQGWAIYGTGVLSPPTHIADRAYFQRLQDSTADNAELAHQLVLGRNTGKHVWLFARRINRPDGSFGGVVYTSLSSEQITALFARLSLDDDGSIALRESDTTLVARYTTGHQSPIAPGDKRLSDDFQQALKAHPNGGTYASGATSIDGVRRTHAYVRSAQYGFLVNVGAGGQASLKDWRTQTLAIGGLAGVFVLALLGFAYLLLRSWRQQELALAQMTADAQTLAASEERFHSLFDAMSEGVALHEMVYDPQGQAIDYRVLDANPAFEGQSGLRVETIRNRLASEVYGPRAALFLALYAEVARTRQPQVIAEYVSRQGKHLQIHAVSPAEHQFATIVEDITERKQSEEAQTRSTAELQARLSEISLLQGRLQEQAIRDPLTGLHNRRFMDETLPPELARAKRAGYSLVLVMLDIDHFKRVNDTYGHAAGDEVLKVLAQMLRTQARESDVVCRYGGEEFVVALSGMSLPQAMERVERWRVEMAATVVHHGDFTISVTVSAGLAGFPEHGADVDTLLARADKALYWSKHKGRNCVTAWGHKGMVSAP